MKSKKVFAPYVLGIYLQIRLLWITVTELARSVWFFMLGAIAVLVGLRIGQDVQEWISSSF